MLGYHCFEIVNPIIGEICMKKNIVVLSLCVYGATHGAAVMRAPLAILPRTVLAGARIPLMHRFLQRSHNTQVQSAQALQGCTCKQLKQPCFLVNLEESRKNMEASVKKAQASLASHQRALLSSDQRRDLFYTVGCFPGYIVNTKNLIEAYQHKCLERNSEQE